MGNKNWNELLHFFDWFFEEGLPKEVDFSERPIDLAIKYGLMERIKKEGETRQHHELTDKGFNLLIQYRLKKAIDRFSKTNNVFSVIMVILTIAIVILTIIMIINPF